MALISHHITRLEPGSSVSFFFHDTATTEIYTLSLHDALPILLVSAMIHGLKPERVQRLREALTIDRRTLQRWRQWWLGLFVEGSFWKEARARFMPPLCQKTMPLSLCVSFGIERRDRLLELLKFLAPITTPTAWEELVM